MPSRGILGQRLLRVWSTIVVWLLFTYLNCWRTYYSLWADMTQSKSVETAGVNLPKRLCDADAHCGRSLRGGTTSAAGLIL